MIILGIETATQQVGCAIGGVEGVLASFHATRGRRHAETLVPAIEFCCEQARVDLKDVSVVAVDIGPGLFTGLRVGIATAKAMAQALRVPMIGLSSLDLLAFPVRQSSRLIVAAVDARRGELYSALYRQVPGGVQRVGDYRVCSPNDLSSDLLARGEAALLVGDGAIRYASTFADRGDLEVGSLGNAYPSAAALVELAQPRALREEFVQPWELEALYLRKSDAEINEEGRRQHTGGSL
ncbi:MAG: tRNA (adenosine(37)-N6)-threonylcarbamoyltransferase complex dimerization subunit type 1 TsaB [Actinobacteria bacterium]|nr:tRNA (adenosine(37)-N6)-threonylcarbamoyltransferase complex dimerization subunit type 1 TsaB [Actinomycetota bacterium]MBV9665643.1 tRNA (adenosine(37)-N6)-threonylcarbamoyltransferase complex dimerization subunit type 1 TsaB [Actinomycetota bacterium]